MKQRLFLSAVTIFLAGCKAASPDTSDLSVDIFKPSALMYLAPDPYREIRIELDVVEGAQPREEAIEALVGFLETYCEKPVTVVRSDVIDRSIAEGVPPEALALQHMQGVGKDKTSFSAYLYVLFYHGPGKWSQGAYVPWNYPGAIFVDMDSFGLLGQGLVPKVLKHEAGHVLGLCANRDHGDGQHCSNDCLMKDKISISKSLFGIGANDLCDACKQDVLQIKQAAADCHTMEFRGPIIIRKEIAYCVAMLPSYCGVILEPAETFTGWDDVVDNARKMVPKYSGKGQGTFVTFFPKMTSRDDFATRAKAIEAAMEDPLEKVSKSSRELRKHLEMKFGALPVGDK